MAESKSKKEIKRVRTPKKQPKKVKPYVHIDTFLATAIPVFNITKMQAEGFKEKMRGKHYQRDEEVFVKELKSYLNIK